MVLSTECFRCSAGSPYFTFPLSALYTQAKHFFDNHDGIQQWTFNGSAVLVAGGTELCFSVCSEQTTTVYTLCVVPLYLCVLSCYGMRLIPTGLKAVESAVTTKCTMTTTGVFVYVAAPG